LDQLADLGCFHLVLTGGEIFVRKDVFKILTHARQKGFYIVILTNGTLITPEVADYIRDLGINGVELSSYGVTAKTFESVTRVQGSFDRWQEAINLFKEREIPFLLKMPVMTLNKNEVSQVKQLAEDLGVRFIYGYILIPSFDGSQDNLNFRLPAREAIEFERENSPHLFEWEESQRHSASLSHSDEFFYCSAGRNSLAISSYGELIPCLELRVPKYDLRKESLLSCWKKLVNYVKSFKPSKTYKCGDCDLRRFCNWCPSQAWLEMKDINACVPYFREIAELRRQQVKEGKS
jgi:radical SAM protein with 4Fe4S-binding SPASM domain